MRKYLSIIIIALFALIPDLVLGQGSGHGAAAAYITTDSEPWGQSSNIDALNGVYGSSGWNKYIYGTDANNNVSNIFSTTRSLVFIEGGNRNTTAMKNFLDANWSTINTWISGGRTLIVSAATNESLGKFQIGNSGVYSERILTYKMYAYSNSSTYPSTTSNVHPLLRTNVTISGVTGDAYYSGDYSGNYVAHNVITGSGINPIFVVTGQTTQYTLAEKTIGSGRMLVGGLTLPFYITYPNAWQPQPQMKRFMYAMLGWVQAVSNPAPTISTVSASSLTVNSVSTGGSSINANGETITAKGVAYSTSQNPTTSSSTVSGGSGTGNFSVNLTNLASNTTYYARAYATSPTGTGYGSQISFTTLPANPTSAASSEGNTICSGTYTNLSVSNAQGTVYWYSDASRTNFVGTGNPRSVNPSATTTYYAFNYNGNFSSGYSSVAITVNQPASQPATASVVVPANADGLTTANLNWGQSTGDGTITYYWSLGTTSTSSYESGYTVRGQTTNPTITATGTGLAKSTGYYLFVKASNSCGTSAYKRSEIFRTNNERIYVAGSNGKVGTTSSGSDASITQYTAYMGDGTAIYAVPDAGYNFVNWSDGVTANPRTDLDATTSYTVTANFAPNRLAFVSQPTETRAGATIGSFAVRYTDTYGNTMTNYNEPITISIQNNPSIGAAGVLSGTTVVTPVNGVATFSDLSINKTGLDYTLKVSAASPVVTTPISSDFDIIPGAVVNYFTVAGIPDPHEAGETTSPKVTAYDAYDNVKYDYTGTIRFSTNNTSVNVNKPTVLPENYTFTSTDQGIKTFTNGVSLKQYGGIYWVKVNDVVVTSAVGQQSDISVTSASLNYYTIKANSNYPAHNTDNNILAGTSFSITAYLYDEYGNLKEDYTGNLDVTLISNASPSPLGNTIVIPAPGLRTFTAGISTISGFTLYNAQETPTITIVETLTGSVGTTPAITVWPEVLDNFYVQENPAQNHGIGGVRVTATQPFDVKVTARDQYNNIKRDYLGRIRFKSSDDNIVDFPDGLQQFAAGDAGIRTFSNAVTIPTTGTYWVRVGDSPDAFKVGELQNIVAAPAVQNAEQSELKFTSYPLVTLYPSSPALVAGDFISVTITPRDAGGNLLCDCKNVAVYLNGVDKHRNGTPVDGVPALVPIPVTDNHDGTYTASVRVSDMSQTNQITASVNGTTISTTLQVGITEPDVPSLIVSTITPASNSITTDENTLVTLQLKDQFGNNRTTDDGKITFSTSVGGFGANNGTASGYIATYAGNGSYTATLYASYDATTHGIGTANITAAADFTSVSHTDGTFAPVVAPTVSITEGLPNLVTSLITANPTSMTTDGNSSVTVQMLDHLGNNIQSDRGSLSLTATLGALTSVTNNKNGTYSATLSGTLGGGTNGTGTSTITGSFTGNSTADAVLGALTDDAEVSISEGLPNVLNIEISVASTSITADESTTVTVQLKDQFGNLIVNNRGTVTLSVSPIGVIYNGTSTGATDIEAVYQSNGAYTATFKLNAFGVGTASITGKIGANAIIDNAVVTVTPGVATKLAMYTQPAHSTTNPVAGVAFSTQPQVSVQDQWGNIVTADGTTEISATTGTGKDVLKGTLKATVTNGVATFSDLSYQKAENMNIKFSSGALTTATSNTLTVVHNVPSYMAIAGTGTQTAGVAQTITVSVYDAYGNFADRFDGTKSLIFSGANDSPAPPYDPTVEGKAFGAATTLTFTDGVATGSMVLYKEETAYVVASHADASYSDSYTGATNLSIAAASPNGLNVVVGQAQAAYLAITGSATQEAGTSQSITITAYDEFNNVATNYTGTKKIRFAGASVSNSPSTAPAVNTTDFGTDTEILFTNGVASASMWLYKVENAVVTATEWTSGSAGITTPVDNTSGGKTYVYQLPVAVTPAAASYLAVTGTDTQTAGASQTVTVTAYDPWNNVATGYTGEKSISFSGASLSPNTPKATVSPTVNATSFGTPTNLTFTSGVATGAMILTKVETAAVKASDGTLTTSDTYDLQVVVSHAAENYFAVTGSSTQVAGVSQDITITMYDAYNNIATGYTGNKLLTFSGASASFYPNSPKIGNTAFGSATTVTFVSGIASGVSMTLYDAADATQDALVDVSNGSQTATSLELAVNVAPNSATNLRLDTQPSAYVRAGDVLAQQPVVSIRDVYGNIVTTDNATTITASRNAGTASETLHGTVTKTAVNGVVSYTDLNYRLMEIIDLDLVSNPVLTTVTSGNIVVDHNATAKYVFTTIPEFIYAGGQRGAYVVTRYDAYDNLVNNVVNGDGTDSSSDETVYLYTSGSTTSPFISTFHNALTGGNTITSVDIANTATTASFWYYSTNEGLHTITGSDKTTAPPDGDTNIDDAVTTLEVKPAALSHFVVSGVGNYNTTTGYYESYYGDPQTVIVEAIDIFGNRKINYTGTITFTVTDAEALRGVDYPADYTFTVGEGADNGIHTFPASLILKPSYKHPDYPNVEEWWVTVVDMAQPSKYGSQTDIYVKKRPILVTANPQSKIYGDLANLGNVEFTVVHNFNDQAYLADNPTPAVYCRTEKVTAATFTCVDGIPSTATVGQYNIIPTILTGSNGFDIANYDVSYANGALTVEKRPIEITATAGFSKVYSTVDPTFTYSITSTSPYNALVNDDAFTGALARATGEDVVATNYAINIGSLDIYNGTTDKSDNYDITFVSSNFEITAWPLVLSNFSASDKTYDGTSAASVTFTDNRPIEGDEITFSTTAHFSDRNVNWADNQAQAKTVNYAVSISGGEQAGNYVFSTASPNTSGVATGWTGEASAKINQRVINVTAKTDSKVYDGNTTSDETPVVDALQTGDILILAGSQTFDTKDQGTGKTLTPSGASINDGNSGNNYAINYVTQDLGTITPIELTGNFTAENKVYDGNSTAVVISRTLVGVLTADESKVVLTGGTGTFDSKDAGINKVVTLTGMTLTGDEAKNYSLETMNTTTATILPKTLSITAPSLANRHYDGTALPGTLTVGNLSGFVGDETVTVTGLAANYSGKDVATYTPVVITYTLQDGNNGGLAANYTLADGTVTGIITQRPLTANSFVNPKVYDGLKSTGSISLGTVDNLVGEETLVITTTTDNYPDENVETGKSTYIHYSLADGTNGGLAGNYSMASIAATGNITPRELKLTNFVANDKIYDGNTSVTGDAFSDDRVFGDDLTFSYNAAFEDKNVGKAKDVNFSSIAISGGADQNNYNLVTTSGVAKADISKRDLTLTSFVANNKTYDGTTSVTGDAFSDNRVAGDVLTFSYNVAFEDKNVGIGKDVNFTNIAISGGDDQNNYVLAATTGTATANISKRTINVTAQTDRKVYDGNTTSKVLPVVGALQADDAVTSDGIQTFDNKNFGTGKVLTPSATVIDDDNSGNNYAITYVANNTGEITKRDLTVTVDANQKKTYGEADPASYTYAITSGTLATGDRFDGALSRTTGENAGTYTINKNTLTILETGSNSNMEANYNLTYINFDKFEIEKRPVTLTATDQTKTYGNGPEWLSGHVNYWTLGTSAFTVSDTGTGVGMAAGESITGVTFSSNGETKPADVGTYSISINPASETGSGGFALSNYDVTYVPATLTVEKRTLNLSNFAADNKVYDGTTVATGLGFDDNRIPGDNLSFQRTAEFENSSVGNNKVVVYKSVSITGGTDVNNYKLETNQSHWKTDANRIIFQAPVTVTVVASDKPYDGNTTATVTLSGNFVTGDDVSLRFTSATFADASVGLGKTVTVSGIALTGEKAGQYTLASTTATATASITPVARTIAVSGDSEYTYSGLPQGPASVTVSAGEGSVSYSYAGTGSTSFAASNVAPTNAGTYQVIATVVADGNYAGATSEPYIFTINKKELTVTAENKTVTYGDAIPVLTYTMTGFVNGEQQATVTSGIPELGTTYTSATLVTGSPVTITAALGTLKSDNYGFAFVNGTISIDKAASTITVTGVQVYTYTGLAQGPATSSVTGSTGTVTYSYSGTGSTTYTTSSNVPTNAGTYQVVATVAADGNYESKTSEAYSFTIGKATLTVTANSDAKTYDRLAYAGGKGVTYSGFVNGESSSVLGGSLSYTGNSQGAVKKGTYSIEPQGYSSANYDISYVPGSLTVNPKELTVINAVAQDKEYDGGTSASIAKAELNGVVTVDAVSLESAETGTFGQAGVGTDIPVSTSMALSGDDAGNYSLIQPANLKADITPRPLTVAAPGYTATKVYDRTTVAGITVRSLSGVVGNDDVSVTASANFDNAQVGSNKTITVSYSLQGSDVANYTAPAGGVLTTAGEITLRPLTITGSFDAIDKVYNRTSSASINNVKLQLVSVIPGDNVTLKAIASFADKLVGNNKPVNLASSILEGTDAGNYMLTFDTAPSSSADITPKALTVTGAAAQDKTYDGTPGATITVSALNGVISGDDVTLDALVGTFAQADAGNGIPVTPALTLKGTDAANYALTQPSGLTASVLKRELTVTGAEAVDKTYDATTDIVILDAVLQGKVSSDDVSLGSLGGQVADKNVGTDKPVTATLTLTGTKASNYTLVQPVGLTVTISPKSVSVTGAVAMDKTFDGTTDAVISGAILDGIIAGDVVNLMGASAGIFASSDVGKDIAVTTGMYLTGSDAGNYSYITPGGLFADINPGSQQINLTAGWNIISIGMSPTGSPLLIDILQPLIDAGTLVKVIDDKGNTIENLGSDTWFESIGGLLATDGYQVKVSENTSLEVEGTPVQLPIDIPLVAGWNMISFPSLVAQNAMDVFGQLIEGLFLQKVMDEKGRPLEELAGDWYNFIGNLEPGEGYKVKVSSACTLTIRESYTKSLIHVPDLLASDHFMPVYSGNGYDHMNLLIRDLEASGLKEGDELGIFDGDLCVGAVTIDHHSMWDNLISIPVSASDGLSEFANGFTEGNRFAIRIFRDGNERRLTFEVENGSTPVFTKGATSALKITYSSVAVDVNPARVLSMTYYPNPFRDKLNIELETIPGTRITVGIVDVLGRKLSEFKFDKTTGHDLIQWQGTDAQGVPVPAGTYMILINGQHGGTIIRN